MHVHRQHNGHQCHENRGADGKYRIAVFACTEYRYQRDDGEYDGYVYENRTEEFGQYRFAECQLLEMGFFVELLTLLIRTILLLQFDILCIGS